MRNSTRPDPEISATQSRSRLEIDRKTDRAYRWVGRQRVGHDRDIRAEPKTDSGDRESSFGVPDFHFWRDLSMTGQFGYHLVSKVSTGIFSIVAFGVWCVKNKDGIVKQLKETAPDELISVATSAFTVEVPKIWAEFQKEPEKPFI